MSKQTPTEPLPHIQAVSSALRQPDQPAATFRALDVAMKAVIGHKVLTVLLYHADLQETERFYSSDLDTRLTHRGPQGCVRPRGLSVC